MAVSGPATIAHVVVTLGEVGGLEQVVENLAEAAREKGYRVVVIAASRGQGPQNRRIARLREQGVCVLTFYPSWAARAVDRLLRAAGRVAQVLLFPYALWRYGKASVVRQRLGEEIRYEFESKPMDAWRDRWIRRCLGAVATTGPVVVHVHAYCRATMPAFVWAAQRGALAILHCHLEPTEEFLESCEALMGQYGTELAGHRPTVVVLAERFVEPLRRLFGGDSRVVVIPNWVEADRACKSPEKCEPGPLVVGTCGRLVARKGFQDVIRAVAQLREEGYSVSCRIAGKGHLEKRLVALARGLGCEDAVEFMGALAPEEMASFMRELDVFVLASRTEGMPLTVLEAMALGKAIVATSVGGIPEMVTDGQDALLVPPRQVGVLAGSLGCLLSDGQLRERLGASARKRFLQSYSREAVWPRMDALYQSHVR